MTAPTRRADATRNRERIVAAARSLLGGQQELRLQAVARLAGIGQGTLYRHFATREALLAEVYRREVDDLVAEARALLATHAALPALTAWLDRLAAYAKVKREVMDAVEHELWRDLTTHSLGPIGDAVTTLLQAGVAEGSLRADVEARDVILLIGFLSRVEPDEQHRVPRLLDTVLKGLRVS